MGSALACQRNCCRTMTEWKISSMSVKSWVQFQHELVQKKRGRTNIIICCGLQALLFLCKIETHGQFVPLIQHNFSPFVPSKSA